MKGEVVYLYAFDVANEIVVGRVGTVLGLQPTPLALRLKHAAPKDVAFHRPLVVEPPSPDAQLGGRPVQVQVHVYEVGTVNICLRVPFDVGDLSDLRPLHRPTLDDSQPLDRVAEALCAAACRDLGSALIRPSAAAGPEAYTAFVLSDLDGEADAGRWFAANRSAVAGLLAGLPHDRLSDAQVAESLRLYWSLERDDLVVIDWDAALVVDLAGPPEDVLYVLEVANLPAPVPRRMAARLPERRVRRPATSQRSRCSARPPPCWKLRLVPCGPDEKLADEADITSSSATSGPRVPGHPRAVPHRPLARKRRAAAPANSTSFTASSRARRSTAGFCGSNSS
ncbi:MAG: hypothetical protein U0746_19130 [Gemmataceae bacterium]